jgi:exosortase
VRALAIRRPRAELMAAMLGMALVALYLPLLRALLTLWAEVPYYSYGFLVPLFSAYLAWDARRELARRPLWPSRAGLVVLAAALAMLFVGILSGSLTVQTLSVPAVVTGALLLTMGPARTRALAFPLAFLVFMTPLPEGTLAALSLPLQQLAAEAAQWMLWLVGVPVTREGLYLTLPSVTLHITEACNGLRFLLAMVVVGVAFAGTSQTGWRRRSLVVFGALLVALLANWLRVAGTGVMAELYGHEVAGGFYHVVWGKVVYAVMLVPFVMLVMALRQRA